MRDTPTIRISGSGSRRAAADLGRAVAKGVSAVSAGRTGARHIDTLRIRLPANSGAGALEQAIRAALEKERDR